MIRIALLMLGLAYFTSGGRVIAQPAGRAELLAWVSQAHQASRDAVRTLHCRVSYTSPERGYSTASECWYSGDAIRIKGSEDNIPYDSVWKENAQTVLSTNKSPDGRPAFGAQRMNFAEMHLNPTEDPFSLGLLALNVPGTAGKYLTLEKMIKQAARVGTVQRKATPESDLVVVQLFFEKPGKKPWEAQIFLDARVNYLIRKTVYISFLRREKEVTEFREFGSGVFFPTSIVSRTEEKGYSPKTGRGKIWDIEINRALPPDIFLLRFPEGITLTDSTAGVRYKVDSNGTRISPEIPFAQRIPPPTVPDGIVPNAGTETQEEPVTATHWFFWASVFLLLAGVSGAVFRWTKRRDSMSGGGCR